MIKAYCYTKISEYTFETWPTYFVGVPNIGNIVRSTSGNELKVLQVYHSEDRIENPARGDGYDYEPYVDIKLGH